MNPQVLAAVVAAVASVVVAWITSGLATAGVEEDVLLRDALPVGSVVASMLNETQFNDSGEGKWVLADGRNVANTDYARITKRESVPDFRGQFVRGHDPVGIFDADGPNRDLGQLQIDSTTHHTHEETRIQVAGTAYQHAKENQNVAGHGTGKFSYEKLATSPAQLTGTGQTSQSDEVRPKNVAVNFFIKISRK